ncbi:ABC transporter ATP-binding protein [Thermodesulforhabdus norvegica]|uniref:Putative ABC transport system ATP-binding protein n=1 Tax=Thermodesulforhabdus norvegica TaxID=39841 RepID=A0A1I4S4C3_9BACT|nr:ABC transporter ATP-binding protein [Thermodesulforhabdus norvegica]SFM59319.1 putative ABC transport system ATP-binding protein [Thermodesulforhabdus norvegica]
MKSPLIRLKGITKVYGKGSAAFKALKGIDAEIDKGEFVAVMGASGSGKSTFLNILGCLDSPTSGSYIFKDQHVEKFSTNERALFRRHHIGFIFQSYNLLSRATALENVELPLIYRRIPKKERRAMAAEALEVVGLSGWADHRPQELSGGQQQRVAIARAIVTRPEVILADEPTGNLDSEMSHEIMKLLVALNRDLELTIVMVTHEPEMANYAKRIIRFVDGRIVDGPESKR